VRLATHTHVKLGVKIVAICALASAGLFVPVVSGTAQTCTVDWTNVHQRIDGFGASSAWRSTWNSNLADMFFSTNNGIVYTNKDKTIISTNNGIGLSLLRSRIAPGGTTVENNIMQMAQKRGARVWSAPWSPQATFKSNGKVNGGGFVGNAANYQAYANQLAGYVVNMTNTYGVNLYAISVQNEPDADVTSYESCNWSAQQIHDFVPYLYNALAASNVASTKIMLPEAQNWPDYSNLVATAMSDSTSNMVSIIADHNYDGANGPATLTKNSYGKALWETEVSLLSGSDSSITNGIYYAGRIHLFMTVAEANAWHYWWLITGNSTGNQGLMDTNANPARRMFVLGQYSRFVRPGYYRIGASNTGTALISAYNDTNSGNFAIVAVNTNNTSIYQTFNLTNFSATSVTPWMTTSNLSLASQTPVTVSGSSFTYTLPALSVVTFVGQSVASAPNTAPTLALVPNQVINAINAGFQLQVTNVATDPDLPSQTLTFSFLSGPTNATLTKLDATNAVFRWRPSVSQANTTNPISVVVADNGTPSLSATNNFTVTVNPVTNPVIGSVTVSGGQVTLTVSGPQLLDYTVMISTNLTGWQVLFTSNSPVTPVTLVDTNDPGACPVRFYRIQLGP
jgi:glucuronoarabinoxylan endo-1,4-beta-xylanase